VLKAQEENNGGRDGIQHGWAVGHRAWTTTSLPLKLAQKQLPVILKLFRQKIDTVIVLIGS
jgi:hypothetical protein